MSLPEIITPALIPTNALAFKDGDGATKQASADTPMPTVDLGVAARLDAMLDDGVSVKTNPIAGLGTYAHFATHSATADNQVSDGFGAFIANGDRVTIVLKYFQDGAAAINFVGGGKLWLEHDPAGGTDFVPLHGSTVRFNEIVKATSFGFAVDFAVRAFGKYVLKIDFGRRNVTAGSGGTIGYNAFILG